MSPGALLSRRVILAVLISVSLEPSARAAGTLPAGEGGSAAFLRGPVVDPRTFGAKMDGVTDDSAAFQAAIDSTRQGTVRISGTVALGHPGWKGILISGKQDFALAGVGEASIRLLADPKQSPPGNSRCTNCYFPAIFIRDSERVRITGIRFDTNQVSNSLNGINMLHLDNVTHSEVVGNVFENAKTKDQWIVNVTSVRCSHVTWSGNTFRNLGYALMPGLGFAGWEDRDITITENRFENLYNSGIQSTLVDSVISSNTFDNPNNAINLGGNTVVTRNVSITGNRFINCFTAYRQDVTGKEYSSGIRFSGNTVDNCENAGTIAFMRNSVFSGNECRNLRRFGFGGNNWDNVTISGNILAAANGNGEVGIITNGAVSRVVIRGNEIKGFGRDAQSAGIRLNSKGPDTLQSHVLENNRASNNSYGLFVIQGSDNVLMTGNRFEGNRIKDLRIDGPGTDFRGSGNVYGTKTLNLGARLKE